jgi:nitronate monooxygenase
MNAVAESGMALSPEMVALIPAGGIGRFGQFCIDRQLAAAVHGDAKTGLFFRGAGRLPFGDRIPPVRELLRWLLTAAPAPA